MIESARHAAVARNIDALLSTHALGRNELADRLGIPIKWMRTVVSSGVSRTERRNADYLRSVAEFFGLSTFTLSTHSTYRTSHSTLLHHSDPNSSGKESIFRPPARCKQGIGSRHAGRTLHGNRQTHGELQPFGRPRG
jgi:hypothetical protein